MEKKPVPALVGPGANRGGEERSLYLPWSDLELTVVEKKPVPA